jgi:tetratricopeptide (TPR) repeat protein
VIDATLAQRALDVFDAALDLPPEDRYRWIDLQCANDSALGEEARLLLSASECTTGILDHAAHRPVVTDANGPIQDALSDRYEIVRELGRGGMATVFLAREHKHDRTVVVKVLTPMIARLCGKERFQREVFIAATLSHPHIVPLIDSGEAHGYLYYVMPWMEGRSLRDVLDDTAALSVQESLQILRDIGGALLHAHAANVVHRDLKPENVLMAAGHAYLLDFGIAKLGDDPAGPTGLTAPGFALGTRRYMAPEQVYTAGDVDARADIFAWGVLAAELLSGAPLPNGEPARVVPAVLKQRGTLAPHIAALLRECVATSPDDRPSDMRNVLTRLEHPPRRARWTTRVGHRRLLTSVAAFSVFGAAGWAVTHPASRLTLSWTASSDAAPALMGVMEDPVALSVLRNETGDSSLDMLGRFAGDFVTDGLQQLGIARVVPWPGALLASEHAAATGAPLIATLRDEALAGTVVTGSYYKLRDSLHLQAQFIDTRSGEMVARLAPIVVPASDPEHAVSHLRDRVLGAVAAARDERVSATPGVTRNPPSFAAYGSFNRGLTDFLAQKYSGALAHFRDASQTDTTFTAAALWAARAALNVDSLAEAGHFARRARAHGQDLGAYQDASLAYVEARLLGDGTAARAAIARAAALAPNSRAGFDHAVALLSSGRVVAAREQLLRMDPNRGEMRGWSSYWTQRVHVAHLRGDQGQALADARELARRHPDRRVAQVLEARALAAAGATAALDSALSAWESLPVHVYWSQGAAMVVAAEELLRRGRIDDGRRYGARAIAWLTARLADEPRNRAHRYWLGSVLYDLGRFDAARPYFESLAREFPSRLEYRGLAALTAARRSDMSAATRWLGPAAPFEVAEHLVFCARIAAINGKTDDALTFLTSAAEHGIEHYAWLAGAAFRDLAALEKTPRGFALLNGR